MALEALVCEEEQKEDEEEGGGGNRGQDECKEEKERRKKKGEEKGWHFHPVGLLINLLLQREREWRWTGLHILLRHWSRLW